jgi:transcriptional regulator with PAS, ATPase and Fis domain
MKNISGDVRMINGQKSLELLKAIGKNDSIGITILDKDGIVIFRNMVNEQISGIKNIDIIGKHFSVVPKRRKELLEVLKTGVAKLSIPYSTTDGKYAVIHRFPLINDDNKIIGAMSITICKDVKEIQDILVKYNLIKSKLNYYEKEIQKLRSAKYSFSNIIGESNKIEFTIKLAKKYADSNSPVLITGDSGTGKEIFAHAIHQNSPRRLGPFIIINCPSIPGELLESELFGYAPGAFSGALKGGKVGKFEMANKGTIFLDEVSTLNLQIQPKLLRVLQDHKIERLGDNKQFEIDFRVISATNKNLETLVDEGVFREDLYYRLSVLKIDLPPLRERKEDIRPLCAHFIRSFRRENALMVREIDENVFDVFHNWSWPGNIRELRNVLEGAANSTETECIEVEDLPAYLIEGLSQSKNGNTFSEVNVLRHAKENKERALLESALIKTNWNKSKTARQLGISRPLLYALIKKYELRDLDIA